MKTNQIINTGVNNINNLNQENISQIYINMQPENFLEDEEIIFNLENENKNGIDANGSLDLQNNKKSHGSSVKTNATFGEVNVNENEEFSFFSLNNQNVQNVNLIEKPKEITKESIQILNNFISQEKNLVSNNNNIDDTNNNHINSINIKNIKNNLINMDCKLFAYFRAPYMRKNIKKKKGVIKHIYDEEQQEDEKIKFDENDIKMEDLKDDESKTNNDSAEEINTIFDKKTFSK